MTFNEFNFRVQERRQITGETYSAEAKALLAFLHQSGQVTDEERARFERLAKGH